jgi:glucosamine-6-phosphate deaminase
MSARVDGTPVMVFPDPRALGMALAREIAAGVDAARAEGRRYILGCPGGRTGRSTYHALAELLAGADLSHMVIAMMDDYVEPAPGGGWRHVPAEAHYSCRRFARDEIVAPLDAVTRVGVPPEHTWFPDPVDPPAYARRLREAGGVDLFIVASGASDGHVAFMKPGMALDSDVAIVELAASTRRDNMATFPAFASLDEVPTHGVSVGLGTIRDLSRSVRLVMHGSGKRTAAERVLAARDFDPDWPATFIHRCRNARILIDEAARPDGFRQPSGSHPDGRIEEELS